VSRGFLSAALVRQNEPALPKSMQLGRIGSPNEWIISYRDFNPVAATVANRHAQRPGIEKRANPRRVVRPDV
jgi:hypothetical protein